MTSAWPPAAVVDPDLRAVSLDESYAWCRTITAEHARTFYYASPLLPAAKRRGAFAVYGFCRTSDDAVDRYAPGGERTMDELLAEQRRGLDQAYALAALDRRGEQPPDNRFLPWVPALADTIKRFDIPRWVFDDLLDGVQMDVSISTYDNFDALLEYCHKVAGVVGLMMTHIFGFEGDWVLRHAAAMGVGMQLTNIARDVADDARLGRIYLPLDWLREHKIMAGDVLAWAGQPARPDDARRLQPVMRRLIDTARIYFQYSLAGVPGLTDPLGRCCTLAMGRVYADILLALEAQHCDPFAGRAHRSGTEKLARIAQIVMSPQYWAWRRPSEWQVWPRPTTPPALYRWGESGMRSCP